MLNGNLSDLASDVIDVARLAGERIECIRREGVRGRLKRDRTLVTAADEEADRLLHAGLTAIEPAAWLSEETEDDRARLSHERVWIVDSLDGTREFLLGLPEYAVAIGLVDCGVPVLGVVHCPASTETYWAVKGGGAFRDDRPLRVSEGNRVLASRSEFDGGEFEPFADSWEIGVAGSIAHKLALVAAGRAAVTFSRGPKHEWDICAGALIVSEAGGVVSDAFGAALRFNQPFPKVKGILAGAPGTYIRALADLSRAGPSARMKELDNTLLEES